MSPFLAICTNIDIYIKSETDLIGNISGRWNLYVDKLIQISLFHGSKYCKLLHCFLTHMFLISKTVILKNAYMIFTAEGNIKETKVIKPKKNDQFYVSEWGMLVHDIRITVLPASGMIYNIKSRHTHPSPEACISYFGSGCVLGKSIYLYQLDELLHLNLSFYKFVMNSGHGACEFGNLTVTTKSSYESYCGKHANFMSYSDDNLINITIFSCFRFL